MPSKTNSTGQILSILGETPGKLSNLTRGLAASRLRRRPSNGEWSAGDVLAHMRSCADVWGGCIRTILAEDKPTMRAVNPRSYIKQTNYPELDFARSLPAFAKQRTQLLSLLKPLSPKDWSRTAIVTGAGAPLTRTALSYAEWLARHERIHVKQIERIVDSVR